MISLIPCLSYPHPRAPDHSLVTNVPQTEMLASSYIHDAVNIRIQSKKHYCSVKCKNTNIDVVIGSDVDAGTGREGYKLDLLVLSPSSPFYKFC